MKVLVTSKSFGKLSRKPIQRLQDAGFEVYGNEKGRLLNEEEMVKAGVTDMHRCVEVMGEVFDLMGRGDYVMAAKTIIPMVS